MDEVEKATLQTLLEHYRNKFNKLEHDFVNYQIKAERAISDLKGRLERLVSEQNNDSDEG